MMGKKKASGFYYHFVRFLNVILMVSPFWATWLAYYGAQLPTVNTIPKVVLLNALYTFYFYRLNKQLDGFVMSNPNLLESILSQIFAAGLTDLTALCALWILSHSFPNLLPGILCFLVQCVVAVIFIIVSHGNFNKKHNPASAVVIYDARKGLDKLIPAYGLERMYQVVGNYSIEEVNAHPELINQARTIFMCGVPAQERNMILKNSILLNKKVFMLPLIGDAVMAGTEQIHMFHLPMLLAKRAEPSTVYLGFKRGCDILFSAFGLILLSPLMLVLAFLIRKDGGPAFYRQVRLTKDGRHFDILKFRSMKVDAEKNTGAVLSAGENDPRITSIGRFIRACRLDELPQLINILKGDMSFIGPRPERPELAREIEKTLPEFAMRLQVKAGLTGFAQVYGKYNTTFYDKLLMDLLYIAKPSLMEDLCILVLTIRILFSKESTEGVGAEKEGMNLEEIRSEV